MVNYLHQITVKSPPICTLSVIAPVHASSIEHVHTMCITSVVAPVSALPIPSIFPTDDKHQEIPDEFPNTNYGENIPSEIMA